ncbi:hypothetical protein CNEO4_170050 [Clostridium neonatale]|nr:hypothetical protein CNEO4_170050 [Clostridium neonatale]
MISILNRIIYNYYLTSFGSSIYLIKRLVLGKFTQKSVPFVKMKKLDYYDRLFSII